MKQDYVWVFVARFRADSLKREGLRNLLAGQAGVAFLASKYVLKH